jgi:hypothetical protein
MTHGDRFRQLDDRKLANYLGGTILDCPPTCVEERWKCERCTSRYCIEQWYAYLTSEAEESDEKSKFENQ